MPLDGLYTISKHAILGMVRTDGVDYATKGIRINAICPGFIDTPLVTPPIRRLLQPQIDKTPMGRMANPQEVADAAVYLASDRASYITGTVLSTLNRMRNEIDGAFRGGMIYAMPWAPERRQALVGDVDEIVWFNSGLHIYQPAGARTAR
ncbi:hypothetical protein LTR93_000174 [Exophiala xenobiotica]|nr:hypothetical protein LTR93_000174 [Exophiala xenobiotica]